MQGTPHATPQTAHSTLLPSPLSWLAPGQWLAQVLLANSPAMLIVMHLPGPCASMSACRELGSWDLVMQHVQRWNNLRCMPLSTCLHLLQVYLKSPLGPSMVQVRLLPS